MLFLLTDGQPTVRPNSNYRVVCPDMVERVNQSNVDIIVVGIGTETNPVDAFIGEVACLDYRDGEEDVFVIDGFDLVAFNSIEGLIRYLSPSPSPH